jgi:hypothetical protein
MSWTGRLVDGGRNDDRSPGNPDSRLEVTIPTTEDYVLFVRNQARTGAGPQYFYRVSIRAPRPLFRAALRQEGVNRDGRPVMVPVDNVAVPLGGTVEFELEISRLEGQKGDIEVFLDLPPGTRGLKLEQVDREPPKPDGKGGMTAEKVTVSPKPVVKDGRNNVHLRLSAAEEAAPGCRMDLGLRLMGVAGAQPFELVQPLWLTISPKQ